MVENIDSFNNSAINEVSSECSITTNNDGKCPVLSIKGEIDIDSASKIYSAIWKATENGEKELILDLENVAFMDSSGLQILLRLREKLRNVNKEVVIIKPRKQIMKLFQLTGFDQLFSFFEDESEAQSFLKKKS